MPRGVSTPRSVMISRLKPTVGGRRRSSACGYWRLEDTPSSLPSGMPTCRSLGRGIWEVRSGISGARITRVLFCISDGRLVLLHAFIKKTEKTAEGGLALARSRRKDVQ